MLEEINPVARLFWFLPIDDPFVVIDESFVRIIFMLFPTDESFVATDELSVAMLVNMSKIIPFKRILTASGGLKRSMGFILELFLADNHLMILGWETSSK